MEKDYALEQQDKEALRLFIKRNNAMTEGRFIAKKQVVMNDMFMKDEVGQFDFASAERAQYEQMRALRDALVNSKGIKSDYQILNKPRRMGLELAQQINKKNLWKAAAGGFGKVQMFETAGNDSGYVAGFDPFEVEDAEPETLEQLIPQLNFNLIEDIALIEKR